MANGIIRRFNGIDNISKPAFKSTKYVTLYGDKLKELEKINDGKKTITNNQPHMLHQVRHSRDIYPYIQKDMEKQGKCTINRKHAKQTSRITPQNVVL